MNVKHWPKKVVNASPLTLSATCRIFLIFLLRFYTKTPTGIITAFYNIIFAFEIDYFSMQRLIETFRRACPEDLCFCKTVLYRAMKLYQDVGTINSLLHADFSGARSRVKMCSRNGKYKKCQKLFHMQVGAHRKLGLSRYSELWVLQWWRCFAPKQKQQRSLSPKPLKAKIWISEIK